MSTDSFFRYTSGRWLHDQDRNEALRYQSFNIDALKEEISQSTGASSVVDMSKLGEGRFNKAFRVQLSDGRTVVARIPTPIAGPQHLVTASEVATMTFLRDRVGLTQVPRIISWSSRAEETPVGAEYIVMDLADGIQLADVWELLTMKQKIRLVQQWMRFERHVLHAFSKGGFGSLYLRKDLPTDSARNIYLTSSDQPEADYVLGPSMFQRGYWEEKYGDRKDLNLDRGPWRDVASYLRSLTNCERAWISKYAQCPIGNRSYVAPWEVPAHLQNPEEHLRLLSLYDKVAPHLIPPDARLLRPTMTLIDSNANNIFLARDAFLRDGTIELSAVIDWQHTAVLPLYITAVMPTFIMDAVPNEGQDDEEFSREQEHLRRTYHAMYFDTGIDIVWAAALSFGVPTPAAQACWHVGYADLQMDLARVALEWERQRWIGVAAHTCSVRGDGHCFSLFAEGDPGPQRRRFQTPRRWRSRSQL
ncbi:hypothetical protein D9619_008868 [Psilocybe cf. subviscida]|uniref:Aminoglycoside phosphotransferase domain-containing protein n=1 Tax=Psilocybe cf. subviscida TaxID=2480587 RepID=A0A8H5BA19_9AGAR|nr:hypothetical protein D9619_008868 [Psilocybe cf. subviscida]